MDTSTKTASIRRIRNSLNLYSRPSTMHENNIQPVGARYSNGDCLFSVWAPLASTVQLLIKGQKEPLDMVKDQLGYWHTEVAQLPAGTKYMFLLDGDLKRPDPASLSQPEGVHEWSEVINHQDFQWEDAAWNPP